MPPEAVYFLLVLSNFVEQLAVGGLLVEEFVDQLSSVADPGGQLDRLESLLDQFEPSHFPVHLDPHDLLQEPMGEHEFLDLPLTGVLLMHDLFCDLLKVRGPGLGVLLEALELLAGVLLELELLLALGLQPGQLLLELGLQLERLGALAGGLGQPLPGRLQGQPGSAHLLLEQVEPVLVDQVVLLGALDHRAQHLPLHLQLLQPDPAVLHLLLQAAPALPRGRPQPVLLLLERVQLVLPPLQVFLPAQALPPLEIVLATDVDQGLGRVALDVGEFYVLFWQPVQLRACYYRGVALPC